MYFVFDAREATGYAFKTRFRWLARVVCHFAGEWFDYSTYPMTKEEFGRLTWDDVGGLA